MNNNVLSHISGYDVVIAITTLSGWRGEERQGKLPGKFFP